MTSTPNECHTMAWDDRRLALFNTDKSTLLPFQESNVYYSVTLTEFNDIDFKFIREVALVNMNRTSLFPFCVNNV